jgi:protein gp37
VADKSAIEWTDATWNPTTGCTKVSQGCKNCYAETLARRLQRMGSRNYANGFALTLQPHMLDLPTHWRQPRRIFVNSMSDVFHEDVPDDYVSRIFEVMERADWHVYQLLTKRPERLARFVRARYANAPAPAHIWLGTSVEDGRVVDRIRNLRDAPATVRFLSCEPLLGPLLDLDLTGIHWVIVGGESGRRRRPIDAEWVREIRRQCLSARVPFFFKQWGGPVSKSGGRILDGRTWDQQPRMPNVTRSRSASA